MGGAVLKNSGSIQACQLVRISDVDVDDIASGALNLPPE
jgi:nicotinate-nucleotide pyrophosphorylase